MNQKIRITYNAPVTITFSMLAVLILVLNQYLFKQTSFHLFFMAPGNHNCKDAFNWKNAADYIRLFTHILGHADWNHLISNLSFILLLGPIVENRYGSGVLLLMIMVTAFVTGVLNACFIPAELMGASGIVFMLILLASYTSMTRNEVPLSFIMVLILFIGREIYAGTKSDNIATFAHIAGGICGSLFGFLAAPSQRSAGSARAGKASFKEESHTSRRKKPSVREMDDTISDTY